MLLYKGFNKERLAAYLAAFGFQSVEDDAFVRVVIIIETMLHSLLNNVRHLSSSMSIKTIGARELQAVLRILREAACNSPSPPLQQSKSQRSKSKRSKSQQSQRGGTVLPSQYFDGSGNHGNYQLDVSAEEQSAFADGLSRAAINSTFQGQSGGTVLPPQYFSAAASHGPYQLDVSQHEQSAFADNLSRAAISSTFQSGGTTLPSEYFGSDSGRYFEDVSQQEQSAFASGLSRAAIEYHAAGGGAATAFLQPENVKALIAAYQKEKKSAPFKVSPSALAMITICLTQNLRRFLAACRAAAASKRSSTKRHLTLSIVIAVLHSGHFEHLHFKCKNM